MNWSMWARIESVLIEQRICPLLAVIPDNQDKKLDIAAARGDFWEEARKWQARGWTIGLHGYQHRYVNQDAGIVGIQNRSEFAGLSPAEQEDNLRRASEIFCAAGIKPQVWIAPAHSFDSNTVVALATIGVSVISDGLAVAPHMDSHGTFWIPQQLWRFRWRPFGVWTVCYHHNLWTDKQFDQFLQDVKKYRRAITDVSTIRTVFGCRGRSLTDRCYAMAHSALLSWRVQWRASA